MSRPPATAESALVPDSVTTYRDEPGVIMCRTRYKSLRHTRTGAVGGNSW
jgi:hypothetical protein